jgi:hypothetical protein
MDDFGVRLRAALADRYAMEREVGAGTRYRIQR